MKTQPNFRFLSIFTILLSLTIAWSCQKDDPTPPASTEKTISAFSFNGVVQGASVDIQGTNIFVTVPYGTDITALAPTITLPKGATISPASGIKQDFTKPVTYTVTAEDGSKQTFTVTVIQGVAPKSTAKEIKSFVFKSFNPAISATIDSTARTITATLPATADLTKLAPEITLSAKAAVAPASGAAQDFSKDVTYTVTAEDGSTKAFVVSVKKETEVAVNPNDLPDFEECLIKSVKLYHPLTPDDYSLVLKYVYKNKKLDQLIYKKTEKYIQASKEVLDIEIHTTFLKYSDSKVDFIDENGEKYNSIFYTGKKINYIHFDKYSTYRGDFQFRIGYENDKIKKVVYQELNKDIGEYLTYEYNGNGNMSKMNILDTNRVAQYDISFKYDTKKSTYKSVGSNIFYFDIFSHITELHNDYPIFIFQNSNNITEIIGTDNDNKSSSKYTFNYTDYNIYGFPTKVKISGRNYKGEEADYDGGVIEFEYHSK
jgi:hypothetical protein